MGKTYVQSGCVITIPAPSGGVTKDAPFKADVLILIPQNTAAETVSVDCHVGGVHSVTKAASQAWVVGNKIYWDDTNKNFTTTSTANTAAGYVVEAVGSGAGETTGKILLNGICG